MQSERFSLSSADCWNSHATARYQHIR